VRHPDVVAGAQGGGDVGGDPQRALTGERALPTEVLQGRTVLLLLGEIAGAIWRTVERADDCDDADAAVNPGATEVCGGLDDDCDGLDNDCDGSTDEDLWIGDGSDGALAVTGTTNLNSDASGGRTAADAVSYSVSAISGDTLTVGRRVSGLVAGDEVLLINLQGSDSAFAAVGTYEFASVASISGTTITLSATVSGTYGEKSNTDLSDQVVMVQRVPHYTDVSVAAGATLTVDAWDGSTGGVLAFRASGEVHVADGGLIDVAGLGFSGGETGSDWNYDAFQGESYAGEGVGDEYGGPYNEAIGGYFANEGGGGANVTGAGGGYGSGGEDADAWYPGVYTAPAGGDTYGDVDLDSMFLGSGGGGVWNGGTDSTGEDPGAGGAGGGILYIGAATLTVDGEAGVSAAGASTDHWAYGSWTYGAGGGAGGSIWLLADALDLAAGAVDGGGGAGRTDAVERDGGAGGDGRIRADATTVGGAALGSSTANTALEDACTPDPGSSQAPG
jgi:Putative metal-binding motif